MKAEHSGGNSGLPVRGKFAGPRWVSVAPAGPESLDHQDTEEIRPCAISATGRASLIELMIGGIIGILAAIAIPTLRFQAKSKVGGP
jgi:hypothetical protein